MRAYVLWTSHINARIVQCMLCSTVYHRHDVHFTKTSGFFFGRREPCVRYIIRLEKIFVEQANNFSWCSFVRLVVDERRHKFIFIIFSSREFTISDSWC